MGAGGSCATRSAPSSTSCSTNSEDGRPFASVAVEEPAAAGQGGGLQAGVDAELQQQRRDPALGGALGDHQRPADLGGVEAVGDQAPQRALLGAEAADPFPVTTGR